MMWESAPLSPTVLQPSNLLDRIYNSAQGLRGSAGAGGVRQCHQQTPATTLPTFEPQGTRRGVGREEL